MSDTSDPGGLISLKNPQNASVGISPSTVTGTRVMDSGGNAVRL